MLLEGFKFLPGTVTPKLLWQIFAAGLCRAGDVLVSYLILSRVSPVTHSVGNCIKRVAVIVISIIFFKTNMNLMSKAGAREPEVLQSELELGDDGAGI
eukprot:jgi/Pico_ML_1/53275/g3847.t1